MQLAARDILEGLWHMHWHGMVHGDLKLDHVAVFDPALLIDSPGESERSGAENEGLPRFVLSGLGRSHTADVDSPHSPTPPPVAAIVDGAVEPPRCRELRSVLRTTAAAAECLLLSRSISLETRDRMARLAPEVLNAIHRGR